MNKKHKFATIDGHVDTITKLEKQNRKFFERNDGNGHCDLPRMKEGNVMAALFAIYPANTFDYILKGLDTWFKLISDPINGLMQVKTVDDFVKAQSNGKIGAVLHLEGVGGIDENLNLLRVLYHLGLRTIGLSWSDINKFATGVRIITKTQRKKGLTDLGRALVYEAQALGITIDVSHLNDQSFWDLHEITEKPIFASHSDVRSVCDNVRNLTDEQIKAISEKKGTIGINFEVSFLKHMKQGEKDTTFGLAIIKNHIDHIVELTDVNAVAIGSDFDGADMPDCLKDCTQLPALWEYLLNNGYSKQDLEKITSQNLLRVFKDTWKS